MFIASSAPCLPGPPLLIASQTTPFFAWRFAASTSEPWPCDFFTNGQPGLNHSSTTILPLNDDSVTSLPSRSLSVKSGAGLPIAAAAFGAAVFGASAELWSQARTSAAAAAARARAWSVRMARI